MMREKENKIFSRRAFLKGLGLATAAVAAPAIVSCGKGKGESGNSAEPPKGQMTYRLNPNTGDKVSLLGYGMMRLPTRQGHPGAHHDGDGEIDQDLVNRQVDYAIEHGLNYFDTSPVYCQGRSETCTGIALQRHKRQDFFVATKMSNMRDYSREASIALFENSLKKLQVDNIDYYLLHAIGGTDEAHPDAMDLFRTRFIDNGILDFLLQQKQEGKIRNLGFSYHGDIAVFDHALTLHDQHIASWDFAQIELNYLDWKHAQEINGLNTNAEYLYHELEKRHIPVVVMEPLLGGRLSNLPDKIVAELKQKDPEHSVASWAFRYAGSRPRVLTVLSGMTYMEHLKDNLLTYCPLKPLSSRETAYLEEDIAQQILSYKTIPCTHCNYCMPCPYGIDIPAIFAHYNKCLLADNVPAQLQDKDYAKRREAFLVGYDHSVPKLRQADHCIGCGKCVPACPQRIAIPIELHRIGRYVESLKQNKP